MRTFNEFKSDAERQEIATLICDLSIDPDAFFEQALNEGVFKKAGDWWKKNFTAPHVVRLQSTHEKVLKALSDFETNFLNLKDQGKLPRGTMLGHYISTIKKNLEQMSQEVASVDDHASQSVQATPWSDTKNWDGTDGKGQRAAAAGMGGFKKTWAAGVKKYGDYKEKQKRTQQADTVHRNTLDRAEFY